MAMHPQIGTFPITMVQKYSMDYTPSQYNQHRQNVTTTVTGLIPTTSKLGTRKMNCTETENKEMIDLRSSVSVRTTTQRHTSHQQSSKLNCEQHHPSQSRVIIRTEASSTDQSQQADGSPSWSFTWLYYHVIP